MTRPLPPMHCPECGCFGNEEDGCEVGEECPNEGCTGIVVGTLHRFYFTFGQAYNLRNIYVVIEAETRDEARRVMQSIYGRNYAFDYDETSFADQPAKYGLTQVPFGTPVIQEHPL